MESVRFSKNIHNLKSIRKKNKFKQVVIEEGDELLNLEENECMKRDLKILKEVDEPLNLTSGGSKSLVLWFKRTLGNKFLLFRFLGNKRVS